VEPRILLLLIRELRVHEKADKHHAQRIAHSIAAAGQVLRPIIVEEKTLTIIDGHHRYTALRLLGATRAPVVLARYGEDIEAVNPPTRTLTVRADSAEEALLFLAELLEKSVPRGRARLELRHAGLKLVLHRDKALLHHALARLENQALGRGDKAYKIRAIAEPPSPAEILGAAARSEQYPIKTTIHVTSLKKLVAPTRLKNLF
jgi:hypothetical protein